MMQLTTILKNGGYYLTIFIITLTGFAQMPIFKRYYISDIPGLGWLAEFYTTHMLHYIFATVFIMVVFYTIAKSLITKSWVVQAGKRNWLRAISVLGLVITGGLMVIKNLKGVYFPHNIIIALDIMHLTFSMIFLGLLPFEKIKT